MQDMNLERYPDLHKKRLSTLVRKASHQVLELMEHGLDEQIVFHNQRLTVMTVNAVRRIGIQEQLSEAAICHLEIAAWFLYSGYATDRSQPEESSVMLADQFLSRNAFDKSVRFRILWAMRRSTQPLQIETSFEKVLYDARWFFLAASGYAEMLERLRQELAYRDEIHMSVGWKSHVGKMIFSHEYLTEYGQQELEPLKRQHYYALTKPPVRLQSSANLPSIDY